MWFAGGQEQFADSAKLAAEGAARQGVQVWYEEYEEMPHDNRRGVSRCSAAAGFPGTPAPHFG